MDFVRGLLPEYIEAVQGSMPSTIGQAIEKAKVMEIAKSIRMEVTGKKIKPSYHPEKKKEKGFPNREETIEETIKRILLQEKGTSNTAPSGPYPKCGKNGHWARDCPTK